MGPPGMYDKAGVERMREALLRSSGSIPEGKGEASPKRKEPEKAEAPLPSLGTGLSSMVPWTPPPSMLPPPGMSPQRVGPPPGIPPPKDGASGMYDRAGVERMREALVQSSGRMAEGKGEAARKRKEPEKEEAPLPSLGMSPSSIVPPPGMPPPSMGLPPGIPPLRDSAPGVYDRAGVERMRGYQRGNQAPVNGQPTGRGQGSGSLGEQGGQRVGQPPPAFGQAEQAAPESSTGGAAIMQKANASEDAPPQDMQGGGGQPNAPQGVPLGGTPWGGGPPNVPPQCMPHGEGPPPNALG
ncbi:hypothetical protein T484DRAFT_1889507, partial [Baffinella frigidus]